MRVVVTVLAVVLAAGLLVSAEPRDVAAGAAAPPVAVTAGGLQARVSTDPWGLTFTDRAGRTVLTEHPGTGSDATGTLGFRAGGSWQHATRVLRSIRQGEAWMATVATTDPARRLAVRLVPQAAGVIALRARVLGADRGVGAVGMGFRARPGERYLGFGERSNAVDQRGTVVANSVADGPYRAAVRPLVAPFVPSWGFGRTDQATYYPVPWLLSTAGYGVLVGNDRASRFRLDGDDAWSAQVPGNGLALRVFAGPRPADALRRFTAATGRQPPPAAPWVFGPWFQPTGPPAQMRRQLATLQDADAPVSVAQTYTHYLPCGEHRGRRQRERRMVDLFHAAGLAVTTYVNPMLCTAYQPVFDEAARRDALTQNQQRQPYLYSYRAAGRFRVGQFDFGSPAGRELYTDVLGRAVADGHDGWMEDFGEYTPLDTAGGGGSAEHNRYPVGYHCTSHRFAQGQDRPLVRFQRSGWTGAARCAQVVWGGDPATVWGFDGLRSAVTQGLTMGLSGVSTWGSDIGGFFALGPDRLTPQLLTRWIQFGAVSGVMRTQAGGIAIPDKPRPQVWQQPVLGQWKRYASLRTQLYPYLLAADAAYRRTGLPIMRHHALTHPGDPRAVARDDQFLFGPDLLAAPVTDPGAREQGVYLPAGRWVDLWRSVRYDASTGGLVLQSPRVLPGEREVTLPAPLAELPLLARAGAVLPLLPPDVDSLATGGELTDRLELLAFPRGRSDARFLRTGRLVSVERPGRWELRIDGSRQRDYRLQASLGTLEQELRPCRVLLDGRPLPRSTWSYDPNREVLAAQFRTRSGRLVVQSCR